MRVCALTCAGAEHTRRRTIAMLAVMEHERADQVSSYLVGTSSVEILKFPIRPRRHNIISRYQCFLTDVPQLQSGSLVGLGRALASSFIAVPLM